MKKLRAPIAVLTMLCLGATLAATPSNAAEPDPSPVPDLSALGTASPVGKAKVYRVEPGTPIKIRVPRVGTITGGQNAVARAGLIRVRKIRGDLTGVTPVGLGLDVAIRHTKLRKPLKLTLNVGTLPAGSVPVFAHRRDDGVWELKPAKLDSRGRIIVKTRTFSPNLPSIINPLTYITAIGNFAARFFAGSTSPVTCPNRAPEWFSVSNLTVTAHACGQNNPAADAERAEVRIKNNRGAVQQVTLAGNRDFVFVQGQPDKLRAAIGALTGTDPANTVFLSPGDAGYMTVGYRRPTSETRYTTIVETTYQSLFLNYAYIAVNTLADIVADEIKWVAAVRFAQKCFTDFKVDGSISDPRSALSSLTFAKVFWCVVTEAGAELADPKKALGTALDLVDGQLPGYSTPQLTAELTKVGGRLQALGRIFKALNLLPILQQNVRGAIDVLSALLTDGSSTNINVHMTPAATTPNPPPAAVRSIVVDNRVTNGATQMREDVPAYLSTRTTNFCKRDGCALAGTDFGSGATLTAECTVIGNRTTNGQDNSSIDDGNPGLYTSTRWYGIRWGDGRFGYVSEVWIAAQFRGGLGLRTC